MFDWFLHQVATGTLAVIFALALSHKLRGYARFRASLQAYAIVPEVLIGVVAPAFVVLEGIALLCLFLPVGPGSLLAFAMLGIYTLAICVNLGRGRTHIDCGCGDQPTPLSAWLVVRNALLMALAWPYAVAPEHGGSPWAWLLVMAVVLVLAVFYLTLEQLLANRGFGELEHG